MEVMVLVTNALLCHRQVLREVLGVWLYECQAVTH